MSARAPLGRGELLRPLLAVQRQSLIEYLQRESVGWIDDPSNADLRFDRNYLRQTVLPPLLARWPAAARTVARGARLAAEADATAGAQARRDWQAAADGTGLDVQVLRRYSPVRQRALLRAWLQSQGVQVPDEQRLEIVRTLADLREDATPALRWDSVQVRRHGGRLLVMPVPQAAALPAPMSWRWQHQPRLIVPGVGVLRLQRDVWGDVDLVRLPDVLQLRWRGGGEGIIAGGLQRDVKSLLREAQVPVWQRAAVPLLAGEPDEASPLLAVADIAVADTIRAANASVHRGRFIWQLY
jgi:tRNA(Ile)-lysidine synthase